MKSFYFRPNDDDDDVKTNFEHELAAFEDEVDENLGEHVEIGD